jgi:hypothetical protein
MLRCDRRQAKKAEEEAKDPTPIKGKWVYAESKSPVDDSDQVVALLGGEPEGAILAFRCQEHRTEAVLVPPAGFFVTGRANVLIRIGDASPATISMTAGTNNRALFASPAPDFIRLMPDNAKLFTRSTGFQGQQADATFDLADVSAARERIANTCHWVTTKSDRTPSPAAPASVQKTKGMSPTR